MRVLLCSLSILSLICVCYTPNVYADEVGDAMDTREKMAKEAQASIQARFEKLALLVRVQYALMLAIMISRTCVNQVRVPGKL